MWTAELGGGGGGGGGSFKPTLKVIVQNSFKKVLKVISSRILGFWHSGKIWMVDDSDFWVYFQGKFESSSIVYDTLRMQENAPFCFLKSKNFRGWHPRTPLCGGALRAPCGPAAHVYAKVQDFSPIHYLMYEDCSLKMIIPFWSIQVIITNTKRYN